jgi:hypothetical protein
MQLMHSSGTAGTFGTHSSTHWAANAGEAVVQ